MNPKKPYSFSLNENSFKKFKIICDECHFNRSDYVQSMIDTFILSVLKGNFDGLEKISEKIKTRYEQENL